jgi:hypothetical protein
MSLPLGGLVAVVAGFGTVCWLGGSDGSVPDLGCLAYRGVTRVDRRGRVVLDRRVGAWLGVPAPEVFEALIVPAAGGGVWVVPVDDFARRFGAVTR